MYLKCLSKRQEWIPHTKMVKMSISLHVRKHLFFEVQPPCSSDRPQDFRLLSGETLKIPAYSHPIENEGTLKQCIFDACQAISKHSVCFEEMWQSIIKSVLLPLIQVDDILSISCEMWLDILWKLRTQHLPNWEHVFFKSVVSCKQNIKK